MSIERVSANRAHGGMQEVHRHASTATGTDMVFSIYIPPHAAGAQLPVLWYLSGLTCTHANVTDKGEYRRACAEHSIILIAPDTSPRGANVPGEAEGWDFGVGAGFYLDATAEPWARHWRMESYLMKELLPQVLAQLPVDGERLGIFGHSMGGHGALTLGLTYPERFKSLSAFAPIVAPGQVPWGHKALAGYLGDDRAAWRAHDAVALIEDGKRPAGAVLVDQGKADGFLAEQLRPELFASACAAAGVDLTLRMQPGYDHSYTFISTFMEDHIRWHAQRL